MYTIQPCEYVKPRNLLQLAKEPIFKVVPKLRIGPVQINLFHFSKVNKNYVAERDSDTKYNIGVYHDDLCVPGWVREREGFGGSTSSQELTNIYKDIDLAIHGHIHSKIGLTSVELPTGRKVPMFIPGSLGMTQDKELIKHSEVDLPVVEIDDNGVVSVKTARFSTHLDQLQFYKTTNPEKKLTSIDDTKRKVTMTFDAPSLNAYLSRYGYSEGQLELVRQAGRGELTLHSAVNAVLGGNNG